MEVEAASKHEEGQQFPHKKEHLFSDLAALRPVWSKLIAPKLKDVKASPFKISHLPAYSVIKTPNKCYLAVNRQNSSLLLYQFYPEAICYEFTFVTPPMAISILKDVVYFLIDANCLAVASLLNNSAASYIAVPIIDHPYAMYAGYGANAQSTYNQGLVLKILHWRKQLEVFEINQEGSSLLNGIFKLIHGAAPFDRVVVIQPDVLACVINAGSLKLVNLFTRNVIASDFEIEFDKDTNSHAVEVGWCSQPDFLACQKNETTFLLSCFVKNTKCVRVFQVTILLDVLVNQNEPVNLAQLAGNSLLTDTCRIEHLCEIHCQRGILSAIMQREGIYLLQQDGDKTICEFRAWADISESSPVMMIESNLDRWLEEDNLINDQEELRNRIVLPFRYPPSLVCLPTTYTELAEARADELRRKSHILTTQTKKALKPVQLVEFLGHLFVVRQKSITILLTATPQEKQHYDLVLKQSEGTDRVQAVGSPFKIVQSYSPSKVSKCLLVASGEECSRLTRIRSVGHLHELYTSILKSLRDAIQQPLEQYRFEGEDGSTRNGTDSAATLVFSSQLYSRIRAIADLLLQLYPYSQEDLSFNDKKAIQGIQTLRRVLDSAYPLYQGRANPTYYTTNLLTIFIMSQSIPLSLSIIEDLEKRSNSILRSVFYGLVSLQCSPNAGSFVKISQFTEFVNSASFSYYSEVIGKEMAFPTTPEILKSCVVSQAYSAFRDRLFNLGTALLESKMDELKKLFEPIGDMPRGQCYNKALAILQASQFYQQPAPMVTNLLISKPHHSSTRKMLKVAQRPLTIQAIENEVDQKLRYLKGYIYDSPPKISQAVSQFISKEPTRLKHVVGCYKTLEDNRKQYILFREVFRLQCEIFDMLAHEECYVQPHQISRFLVAMRDTLSDCLVKLKDIESITEAQAESKVLAEVNEIKRLPRLSRSYLEILSLAQDSYSQGIVPRYPALARVVSIAVSSGRRDLFAMLLANYTKSEVMKQASLCIKTPGPVTYSTLAEQTRKMDELMGVMASFTNVQCQCPIPL